MPLLLILFVALPLIEIGLFASKVDATSGIDSKMLFAPSRVGKSPQGARGSVDTLDRDGESRAGFSFFDEKDPRSRTYVQVTFPAPKKLKEAEDLLMRLPF